MAGWTGLEPATSGLTGQRSNQSELPPHIKSVEPRVDTPDSKLFLAICKKNGRRNRARTCDPSLVRAVLSQLSYPPESFALD